MSTSRSYIMCGTPRTGSTLLCSLLASTQVLGRPESYFREPDEPMWAHRFSLPVDGVRVCDYSAFVAAVRAAGTTGNGVFAARIMWGSLERLVAGLATQTDESDLAVLQRAFAPLAFVHLQRLDVIGQAVSWARAEQSGFWQEGDVASGSPRLDLDQLTRIVATIGEHNTAWQMWFDDQHIDPLDVTYEQLVRHPGLTVRRIADLLGMQIPDGWTPAAPQRRQADELNAAWAAALHAALGS